jgi:uroporphyrinogen decarboxylase
MVEGAGSSDYRLVKTMLYQRPDLMHKMLAINADSVAQYLNAQIEAGAQAVMIFDSWGGVLADAAFHTFSLAYTARVLAQLKREHNGVVIPRLVFTKGGGQWLEAMKQLDCEVLGLDWTVNLARARALVGENGPNAKALQGNLDPNVLFANPAQIEAEVAAVLGSFGAPHTDLTQTGPAQIFNLGHGISQFTPPENVDVLVRAVHSQSRRLRASQG